MLNVYENGFRIQTPWYAIFPERSVERMPKSGATREISNRDQVREASLSHPTVAERTYHTVEQGSGERQRVLVSAQLMSTPVQSIERTETLGDAWQMLTGHSIRHMPVVDENNKLCGIISDRDILHAWSSKRFEHRQSASVQVAEIMVKQVLTAELNTSIRELSEAMTLRRVGAIPVINSNVELIGIVTRSDVLRVLMNEVPVELWT